MPILPNEVNPAILAKTKAFHFASRCIDTSYPFYFEHGFNNDGHESEKADSRDEENLTREFGDINQAFTILAKHMETGRLPLLRKMKFGAFRPQAFQELWIRVPDEIRDRMVEIIAEATWPSGTSSSIPGRLMSVSTQNSRLTALPPFGASFYFRIGCPSQTFLTFHNPDPNCI